MTKFCALQLLGGEYADICAQGALRTEAAVTGVRTTHVTLSRIPAQRPCLDGLHVAMAQVVRVCVHLPYGCMYAETWATTASAFWPPSLSATWPNWQRCKLLLPLLDFYFHILVNATHYQCSLCCLLPVPNRFKFLWDIFLRSIACLFNLLKARPELSELNWFLKHNSCFFLIALSFIPLIYSIFIIISCRTLYNLFIWKTATASGRFVIPFSLRWPRF